MKSYKGKTYTCIKLGKKLYWDNGKKTSANSGTSSTKPNTNPSMSPSPSQSPKSLKFFQAHRTDNAEELLEIVVDSKGKLISKNRITSGPKMGLTILDSRAGQLLVEIGSAGSELYLINQNRNSVSLGIAKWSSLSTNLSEVRLGIDGKSLYAFDFDRNFYRYDLTGAKASVSTLISSAQFKTAVALGKGDSEFDWIEGFEIRNNSEFFVMTKHSKSNEIKFWTMILNPGSPSGLTLSLKGQVQSAGELASVDMSMSPDGSKIAVMYTASLLTPKERLLIISTNDYSIKELPTAKLYEGDNYFLAWADNTNLVMTIGKVWTADKDGGRVTCLLRIDDNSSCEYIQNVSGYSLMGER
jgi:hypothetical protein